MKNKLYMKEFEYFDGENLVAIYFTIQPTENMRLKYFFY